MSGQAPPPSRHISPCYQNFIVRPTVSLDGFHNRRSNPCHICQVTSVHFLQTGGKLLILYLRQSGGVGGWSFDFFPSLFFLFFLRLQGGEVYKSLRSQVRGSQGGGGGGGGAGV